MKQKRYWTLSTDGSRTPIEVTEFEGLIPMSQTQPHQQTQYVQVHQAEAPLQPIAPAPVVYTQSAMSRPQQRSPIPFMAAGAGLFICFYAWSAGSQVERLTQQNDFLTQQVTALRAENQALKEMAAIVR